MGHLVTHWHETGVVLFPRVCECVFGAATGLAMRRSETTCLLRFHVWSAAPYSHCMTQRDSAFYVRHFFLRQLLKKTTKKEKKHYHFRSAVLLSPGFGAPPGQ